MSTIPNGPYHYIVDRARPPIVCEVFENYVAIVGEPDWKPIGQYKGEFIRLQEVRPLPTPLMVRDDA